MRFATAMFAVVIGMALTPVAARAQTLEQTATGTILLEVFDLGQERRAPAPRGGAGVSAPPGTAPTAQGQPFGAFSVSTPADPAGPTVVAAFGEDGAATIPLAGGSVVILDNP